MSDPVCTFRRAAAADEPAIVRITAASYTGWIEPLGGLPVPMTEDYAPRIARGEVWLAEADGAPTGLIVLEPRGDHLLIFSVAVAPASQGRGIGRALLGLAEARAAAAGMREVRLYTNAKMTSNIALYQAAGYRETGRRPSPSRPGWVLVDMAKPV